MGALLKSEWRKLIYARAHWGLLIAGMFVAGLGTAVTPVILDNPETSFGLGLDQTQAVDAVYANAISSYFFAIIIGIMLMATMPNITMIVKPPNGVIVTCCVKVVRHFFCKRIFRVSSKTPFVH